MEQVVKSDHEKGEGSEMDNSSWNHWVCEMRFTWILIGVMTILPAVFFGTAFPAMILLTGSLLLGVPTALAAFLLIKNTVLRARMYRRVVVMVGVAALTVVAVLQTDKLTPAMASPIAKAIEDYKQDVGSYPETLAALNPKYLTRLPVVRVAVIQPEVLYRLKDGRPYLAVPSAAGDAFSIYEYSFVDEHWVHHD